MRGPRFLLSLVVVLFLVTAARGQSYVYTTFPQLAVGGGWSCDFFVNNPGLASVSGLQISFFDDNGAPLIISSDQGESAVLIFNLQPGETKIIRATLSGNTTVAGYATLRRPFPSPVTSTMIVRFKSGPQVLTQLGLPHQYTVQHYSFPVEINGSTHTNTGVAVANPTFGLSSAKAQTFIISLVGPSGVVDDFTTLTLPAGGHTSMMINDARLFPDLTTYSGTATISAAKPFGFVALRIEDGALGTVAVEEGSVLPPAQLTGSTTQETEPNESRSQAQGLTLPALVAGTISTSSDLDYFSFSGKQGDVISVMAETEGMSSDLDTVLTMQDSSGITISSNDQNFLFFQNDSFLHLVLPADGTYYIRVTSYTGEGGSSFVYRLHVANHSAAPQPQEPTIQSISPTQGSPGSSFTLTINGSNLTGTSTINFSPSSGITVSNIQSTATQVTASINISSSATTGARQVSVTTPGGTSNALAFTVGQTSQPPTITSLSPTQGNPGSSFTLTIAGTNLGGATAVSFSPSSGITVSNVQSTATQVTASINISSSATTGARQVSVTTPAGTSNALAFTVSQSQTPTITSLSPSQGTPGSSFTLTINGSNLTGATAVSFSPSTGITVSNIQSSATQVTVSITISSTAGAGDRQVSVTTPAGTSNTLTFAVAGQAPTITSISPNVGTPGLTFTMTIYGSNLTGVTAVNFSPSTGITVSNIQIKTGPTRVTASIKISSTASTGARTVSVTSPSGTSNTKTFTVTQAGSYDGTWTGTTGQGKEFSFKIVGNALTEISYAGELSGACSATFSGTTTTNIPLGGTVIDFTISSSAPFGVSLDVNGSFTSTSSASGTVKLTLNAPPPGVPGCYGWVQTTWSASKP